MRLEFVPLSLDRQHDYNAALNRCPQIPTSDYAFANIWGWADHYGLEWAFENGLVWIRQTKPETVHWAPLGDWDTHDWTKCQSIRNVENFTRVPEYLARLWSKAMGERIEIREARDHWDYIYSVQELIELKGNRFHKKKNLLKQFEKKYDAVYSPMGPECVEEVLEMQAEWLGWLEEPSPTLIAENSAITRVLHHFDQIGTLRGGAIRVNGKVVAYTVAEPVGPGSIVVHFEKGDTHFKGVYQAINQQFLAHDAQGVEFVNREQDLGEEGLRKAKLSYNPQFFLKKYEAEIK